jgi:hypothetical protein
MRRDVDGAGAIRALVATSGVMDEGQEPLYARWGRELRLGNERRKTRNGGVGTGKEGDGKKEKKVRRWAENDC